MIRKRIEGLDDRSIYLLIKRELLPFKHKSFPATKISLKEIQKRLRVTRTFVVSSGKGKPAFGFVSCIVKNTSLYVDMLVVKKWCQGRGIGSNLLKFAERFGKANGCREATLFVDSANDRALHFYRRQGYQFVRFAPELQCYMYSKQI